MSESEDKPAWLKDIGLLGVIASEVLGFTGAGIGIGYLAWHKLGWPWWVLMLSTFFGLIVAFYRIYQMTRENSQ